VRAAVHFLFRSLRKREFLLLPGLDRLGPEDLADLLAKVSYALPGRDVYYLGAEPADLPTPDYLAPVARTDRLRRVGFFRALYLIATFRNLLLWRRPEGRLGVLLSYVPNVFIVDRHRDPMEGWNWFHAFNYTLDTERKRPRYLDFEALSDKPRCYVFGTGPSLASAYDLDFADGHRVICNTMVKNARLMDHIKPDFLLFGDAIYHFGPTRYAAAFRAALGEFARAHPQCKIIIPEYFYDHFCTANPSLADSIHAIPPCSNDRVSMDWAADYCFHAYGNALNQLLLPLASTLSKEILLLGFDGRKPGDTRFWSHDDESNFPDLLHTQELSHPAFFERDLADYAKTQGDDTELLMSVGEKAGITYRCLEPSTNPALAKRYAGA